MSNPTPSTKKSQSSATSTSAPQPTPPIYSILDDLPLEMKRNLCMIGGNGYAAVSLPIRIERSEKSGKNGAIVKLNPPEERIEKKLVVIRDDGVIFGFNNTLSSKSLGFDIALPESPPRNKLWSPKGVKDFANGIRPNPPSVFRRLVDIVDRFIDFSRSLADQQTMAEFISCYILATWFLEAFNVIGFLWLSGERGSGKTNLLHVVADLSYLGQVILAGGSYASLRDLADNGATLAFDDAENLSDPRKSDPDKRALLLAGNHRGITVPLKEPDGKRGWKIRHVNAFCPRIFSAIALPDPVLSSRAIVVPLIRTTDSRRGNFDPVEHKSWPHDWRQLVDDLWALGTTHLVGMRKYDEWVGSNSQLIGRTLQPWRAILAVAAWLEKHGVHEIFQRMEKLAHDYQQERPEFEVSDLTSLVIHALFECADRAVSARGANAPQRVFEFQISTVTNIAISLAKKDDWDIDLDLLTPRCIGRVVSQLRLEQSPRPGGKGSRRRKARVSDLQRLSSAYNVPLPQQLEQFFYTIRAPSSNGSNGINGSNGPASPAMRNCYACGTTNWVSYPNGKGEFCGTCHPGPHD